MSSEQEDYELTSYDMSSRDQSEDERSFSNDQSDKTILFYGGDDCDARYSKMIEQVLSKHLYKKIVTKVEIFDHSKNRWIYSAWIQEGGLLEPIAASETIRVCLRRLVTLAYSRNKDEIPLDPKMKNGGVDIIERDFLFQGGMMAYTFYPSLPTFFKDDRRSAGLRISPDNEQINLAVANYWILRGWSKMASLIDNSVRPPLFNPDRTVTIYVRNPTHIHQFARAINQSLRENRRTPVEYKHVYEVKKIITFRAQEGYPLIIGDIGIREDTDTWIPSSTIKQEYLQWLYPCIGDEDLSWEEFGRIIKDHGDCYALEETPENTLHLTFMRVARVLSVAGIYPLGPFKGLMPWPYYSPDIIKDFRIMGYEQPELQLLDMPGIQERL